MASPTIVTVPSSGFPIVLALLSALSFAPQLLRLVSRRDSSGISLVYVLFHLVSATQQLTLGALCIRFGQNSRLFIWGWPPSLLDWVNLAQLLIVWLGLLVLFIACLSTTTNAFGLQAAVILVYLFVLLLTLVPLAIIFKDSAGRNDDDAYLGFNVRDMFFFVHIQFLIPLVTFLAAAAFYPEVRAIVSRRPGDLGSLSLVGLAVQASVFTAVAISWVYRAQWPQPYEHAVQNTFGWYRLVGWAAVNNAVFATVQALLFWLAYARTETPLGRRGETSPLLEG